MLVSAPILAYPPATCNGKFILDTVARESGLGDVLSQVKKGKQKDITHGSISLKRSHKELLSIVTFLKHFRNYLFGQEFVLEQIMPH